MRIAHTIVQIKQNQIQTPHSSARYSLTLKHIYEKNEKWKREKNKLIKIYNCKYN